MKKKLLFTLLSIAIIAAIIPIGYTVSRVINPDVDWGGLLRERQSMAKETDFELYVEGGVENAPYYGAKFEPRGGSYIGMTADSEAAYKPLGSYLSYIQGFSQGDLYAAAGNIVRKNDVMPLTGWTVTSFDGLDYTVIDNTLRKLNSYGKPMFVRFANEMNDGAGTQTGDDPEKYVEVFRNVADLIHNNYPNLAVVWSPLDLGSLDRPFEIYYPGDEYVDWIGASCYSQQYFDGNPYADTKYTDYFMTGSKSWATNRLKPIIKFMEKYKIKKPLMISEGGVSMTALGEAASYDWVTPRMRNMYYNVIMKYPQVKMINYFNTLMTNEKEWFFIDNEHSYAMDIINEAADSGAYVRTPNGLPEFVFVKANAGNTILADEDGNANFYTLAHIPNNPNISVEYRIDNDYLGTSDQAPYKVTLNIAELDDGSHTLKITGGGQSKEYKFIKRDDRIRFNGEPDMEIESIFRPNKDDVSVIVVTPDGIASRVMFDEQAPFIDGGHTLVPLRNIFEAMDTPVNWNGESQTVTWDSFSMVIGDEVINKLVEVSYGKDNRHRTTVLEDQIGLAMPARIENGRTMVPLRAIAECTGYTVNWDEATRTVTITM